MFFNSLQEKSILFSSQFYPENFFIRFKSFHFRANLKLSGKSQNEKNKI